MYKMKDELDAVYETSVLLYYGYDMDNFKATISAIANETGINEMEIYQRYYKVIDKYIKVFLKYRIPSDRDSFYFKDTSSDYYYSFINPFFIDRELINTIDGMNNDQMLELLLLNCEMTQEMDLSEYKEMPFSTFIKSDNLMSFINKFELSDNEKWKLLLLLQNPQDYYKCFSDLIKMNIAAYEKAASAIKASIDKYMKRYNDSFANEDKELKLLKEMKLGKSDFDDVIPTLITGTSVLVLFKTCFYGLMAEDALTYYGYASSSKEYLLTCLKALSDASKLEILSMIKTSPKYATEIAAQLGLTPATVSYHMSALLAAKLVYIEKNNGKFYYYINDNTVKDILDQIHQLIL